ncbi:hypothetical protein [Rhizobium leguminosarum]|uniref:hypothetical protein n=1 Tax=Rhizobium leguminosarum TaxID=384 RepID=UPI001C97B54F|nr:hypothetical protein [Rhizobium leguminosarum]MBY5714827.1 hypothetical protein [Rhizobium leguminosarum]
MASYPLPASEQNDLLAIFEASSSTSLFPSRINLSPSNWTSFWLEVSSAFSWLGKERKDDEASQLSDAQKAFILKQGDEGVSVAKTLPQGGHLTDDLRQL